MLKSNDDDVSMSASDSPYRTEAYSLAFAWLDEVVPVLGKVPSQRDIADHLKRAHGMTPSNSTLGRIQREWARQPKNADWLAQIQSGRSHVQRGVATPAPADEIDALWAALDGRLRSALERRVRSQVDTEANERISVAELALTRAQAAEALAHQRAAQVIQTAEARVERAEAAAGELRTQLAGAQTRLDAHVAALPAEIQAAVTLAVKEANAQSQRMIDALQTTLSQKQQLIEAAEREYDALRMEMAKERGDRDARESERYSGLNQVLGQQIADLKVRIQELEKALAKERERADAKVVSSITGALNVLNESLSNKSDRVETSLTKFDELAKAMIGEVRAVVNESGPAVQSAVRDEIGRQLRPVLQLAEQAVSTSPVAKGKGR